GLQNEASARRADVENISCPDMFLEPVSSHSVPFDLHADSIALGGERARKRIAAKHRRPSGAHEKAQHDVLAGKSGWQRLTVGTLHRQRDDLVGLPIDGCHREAPKSRYRRT